MRIQLLSDLHTEFMPDRGRSFIRQLNPTGIDVLVLAGDIAVAPDIPLVLRWFSERYPKAEVIYVHGNHEFYRSSRTEVIKQTREALLQNKNLHWLDCGIKEISGQRFLGTPLWFPYNAGAQSYKGNLSDFSAIKDYEKWVYLENSRARAFLHAEMRRGDIVVTHHLPTNDSVADRFRLSPINAFFVSDESQLIHEVKPALWMHGHTHDSMDYRIVANNVRVVCNPYGYEGYETNKTFTRKVIELPC